MIRHPSLHFAALFFLVLAVLCCEKQPDEKSQRAHQIWKHNKEIVLNAIQGEVYEEMEFLDAIIFFSELTGIDIRVELYTLGATPTAETSEDLGRVQQWYEENGDRLYFDPESRSVRVLEEK